MKVNDSDYLNFFWIRTKIFFFSFISLTNILIFSKNKTPLTRFGIFLMNNFSSIHQKTKTNIKIYIVLSTCIEEIFFISKYFKIDCKKKIFDFKIFTNFETKICNFPFFWAICNTELLIFLQKKEKIGFKFRLLVNNLNFDFNFLYHVSRLYSVSFVIFLQNKLTNKLSRIKFCSKNLFVIWKKSLKKYKIYLEIRNLNGKIKPSKVISPISLLDFKKFILLITSRYDITALVDYLNNKKHNYIFLISYFPKDLIFKKIKSFNSTVSSTLVLMGNFFFINKILTKIDLREVSFIHLTKKNSFECISNDFDNKKFYSNWHFKKKIAYFKKIKNTIYLET